MKPAIANRLLPWCDIFWEIDREGDGENKKLDDRSEKEREKEHDLLFMNSDGNTFTSPPVIFRNYYPVQFRNF